MTSPPIDTVLFDLDGTLVEYERHGSELLELAFDDAGVEPFFGIEAYYGRYSELVDDADGTADLRESAFAAIAAERDRDPAVGRAVARAYEAERDHSRVYALPGAEAALDALAEDHRLGLITNGSPGMQRVKLDAAGLDDRFETAVFAGHDTVAKPDPAPFHRALDALGGEPHRAVYVGNSLSADVAGANAAGLTSVWVPSEKPVPEDGPEPDYAFPSLDGLVGPPW